MSRVNGVDPVELAEKTEKLATGADLGLAENSGEIQKKESLNEKIHRIIHQDAIVLFMKGNPKEPKCKFRKINLYFINFYYVVYYKLLTKVGQQWLY